MSVNSKMTALMDAIRSKAGISGLLSLDTAKTAVDSIQTGITPSGSVTLTSENTYDVTEKATAIVDMSATRARLAEAITAKGIDTLPDSSFDAMIANVGLISGGIDVKPATRCEVVTIGANTVSNPIDAVSYFGQSSPYKGFAIILLDSPTTQNQFGVVMSKPSATALYWWRWKDNSKNWPSTFNNTWDTRLVEGSKYLIIEW